MIDVTRLSGRRTNSATDNVLVDASFTAGDAKDFLHALLKTTINVHKLQSLRSQVSQEQSDATALARIEELQTVRTNLDHLLAEAGEHGFDVRIRSHVELSLEPKRASARPAD